MGARMPSSRRTVTRERLGEGMRFGQDWSLCCAGATPSTPPSPPASWTSRCAGTRTGSTAYTTRLALAPTSSLQGRLDLWVSSHCWWVGGLVTRSPVWLHHRAALHRRRLLRKRHRLPVQLRGQLQQLPAGAERHPVHPAPLPAQHSTGRITDTHESLMLCYFVM